VKNWLIRHPRFHIHFIPTSSSWLNLVERWFAELTNRKISYHVKDRGERGSDVHEGRICSASLDDFDRY
jgi:transposase